MQNDNSKIKNINDNCIIIIILLFITLISGCATYKTSTLQRPIWEDTSAILRNIEGKTQNLSLQQIEDTLISSNSKLVTLRANAELVLNTQNNNGPVRCKGIVLYQNPANLRVMGAKFATTVFDMSSDGNKFWLYVPLENKVYTGKCNAFHKIEALGINIFPGDMAALFNHKEAMEGGKPTLEIWPAYWLVHLLDMEKKNINLKGNLLIDRINADVFRCELFNSDGSIRLQAVFTNYSTHKECKLPQRIDVRWPAYNTTLGITLSNITVNEILNPKVFTLTIPPSAQTINVD